MPKNESADPAPAPPVRPEQEDCCHGGCDRCVFDLYEEALERYESARRAWEERRRSGDDADATR